MKNYKLQFETKTIKIKIKIRLAEKELTYLTPIQSENDFNLNSKIHIVYNDHFLCTDSSCATNFIPTKISYCKKRGRDLNSHLRDGFIVCTPRVTKILDCSLEK